MYKYRLFIGRNDKDTKRIKIHKKRALSIVHNELKNAGIFGYTILDSIGVWQGHAEKSFIIEINSNTDDAFIIYTVCERLNALLNQNCILVEMYNLVHKYI